MESQYNHPLLTEAKPACRTLSCETTTEPYGVLTKPNEIPVDIR